mgnify:CR=1 FL=1
MKAKRIADLTKDLNKYKVKLEELHYSEDAKTKEKQFLMHLHKTVENLPQILDKDIVRAADGILWNLLDRNHSIPISNKFVKVDQKNSEPRM